jgi:hypothetical protein
LAEEIIMVHYNVRFTLKDGVDASRGVAVVEELLRELCAHGESSGFHLRRDPPEGSRFHAVVEFEDDAAMARAMKNQAERGIHRGGHGRVVDVVSEFKVEISRFPSPPRPLMPYACEI